MHRIIFRTGRNFKAGPQLVLFKPAKNRYDERPDYRRHFEVFTEEISTVNLEKQKKPTKHVFVPALSSAQRATLKGMAHHLKALVQIGAQGLTENVVLEIANTLGIHELVKVQLPGETDAAAKEEFSQALTQKLPPHAHIVARIGRQVILFQEQDPENAKIVLKNLK
jgi:RNA-binding protein